MKLDVLGNIACSFILSRPGLTVYMAGRQNNVVFNFVQEQNHQLSDLSFLSYHAYAYYYDKIENNICLTFMSSFNSFSISMSTAIAYAMNSTAYYIPKKSIP